MQQRLHKAGGSSYYPAVVLYNVESVFILHLCQGILISASYFSSSLIMTEVFQLCLRV